MDWASFSWVGYTPSYNSLAQHTAAFMAAMCAFAAGVFAWRMTVMVRVNDPRRYANFFWLTLMFIGIAGNRVGVVVWYKTHVNSAGLLLCFAVLWAFATLMLARAFTIEYCGNKGWVSALVLSTVVMVLFG